MSGGTAPVKTIATLTRIEQKRRRELVAWRKRMGISLKDAATLTGYSYTGFLNLVYGHRAVNPRVLIIARGIEAQRKPKPQPKTEDATP